MPTLLQKIRETTPGTAAANPEDLLRNYWEQHHAPKTPEEEAEGYYLSWDDFVASPRVQESLADEEVRLRSPKLGKYQEVKRGVRRGIVKNTAGTFLEVANFIARNVDDPIGAKVEELSEDGLMALERLYDDPEWRTSYEAATGDWRNMNHFVSAVGEGGTSIAAILGTGATAGLVKGGLKGAAKKQAARQAKAKIRKASLKHQVTKIGAKFTPGMRPASMAAGSGLMAGEQAGDIRQFEAQTGEDVPRDVEVATVATNALVGGLLEVAVPMAMVDKPLSAFMKRKLGKEMTEQLTEKGFKAWAKKTGAATAGGMFGEFGTEYSQSVLQNTLAKYGYDYDRNVLEGAFESGLVGLVTGGGMGAASATATHALTPKDGLAREMSKTAPKEKKVTKHQEKVAKATDDRFGPMDIPETVNQPMPDMAPPDLTPRADRAPTVEDQRRMEMAQDYEHAPTQEEINRPTEPVLTPQQVRELVQQEELQRKVTGGKTLADIESGVDNEFRGLYSKGPVPKLHAPPAGMDVNALLRSRKGWASLTQEEKDYFGDQRTFHTARIALKNQPTTREDILKGKKAWGSLNPQEKELFKDSKDLYKSRKVKETPAKPVVDAKTRSQPSQTQKQPQGPAEFTPVKGLNYKTPDTDDSVNTLRRYGVKANQHYGNPFGTDTYGAKAEVPNQGTDAEVSDKYRDWLLGTYRQDVAPKRRQWILDQIESGRLDGKKLLYFRDTARNHARELQKLVNRKLPERRDEAEKVETPVQAKEEAAREKDAEKILNTADDILDAFKSFEELSKVEDAKERSRLITILAKDPRRIMNARQFAGAKETMAQDYAPKEGTLPKEGEYQVGTLAELKALPGGKLYTSNNPSAMKTPEAAHRLAKKNKLKNYDIVIRREKGKADAYYAKERGAKKGKATDHVRLLGKVRSAKAYIGKLMEAVKEEPQNIGLVNVSSMINRIATEMEVEANPLFEKDISAEGVDTRAAKVNKPLTDDEKRQKQQNIYEQAIQLFKDLEIEIELALANPDNSVDDIMNMLQGYVSQAVYEGRNYFQAMASTIPWTPRVQAKYEALSDLLKGNIELTEDEAMILGVLHAAAQFNEGLDRKSVTDQINKKIQRLERQKELNVDKAIAHFNKNIPAIREHHARNVRRIKNDIGILTRTLAKKQPAEGDVVGTELASDLKGLEERILSLQKGLEVEERRFKKASDPMSLEDIKELRARNISLDNKISQLEKAKNMTLTNAQVKALQISQFNIDDIDSSVVGWRKVLKSVPPSAIGSQSEIRLGRLQTATGRLSGLLTGKFGEQIRNYIEARRAGKTKMKLPQLRGLQNIFSAEGATFPAGKRIQPGKSKIKKTQAGRRPGFVRPPQGMPTFPMEQLQPKYWRWNEKFIEDTSNEFFASFKSYDPSDAEHRQDLDDYLDQAIAFKLASVRKTKESADQRLANWIAESPENRQKFMAYQEKKEVADREYKIWKDSREIGEDEAVVFDDSIRTASIYDNERVGVWSGLSALAAKAPKLTFTTPQQAAKESARLRGTNDTKINSVFDNVSGLINSKSSAKSVLDALGGLKNLRDYGASDKLLKILKGLNHVGNVAELEAMRVDWTADDRASYKDGVIYMPEGSRNLYSLAHEVMHGLTAQKIQSGGAGVAELSRIYQTAKDLALQLEDPTVGVMYSFDQENDILGMQEFAAEVFINPELQEFLNGVKDPQAPKQSLWSRFVRAVANLLGIKMDGKLLSSAMQATYGIAKGQPSNVSLPGRLYQEDATPANTEEDRIADVLAANLDITRSEARDIMSDPAQSANAYEQLVRALAVENMEDAAGKKLDPEMESLVDATAEKAKLKAMKKEQRYKDNVKIANELHDKLSRQDNFFDKNILSRVASRWHSWTLTMQNMIDVVTNFSDETSKDLKDMFVRRVNYSKDDKIIRIEDRQGILKSIEDKYNLDMEEMHDSSRRVLPAKKDEKGKFRSTWDAMMIYASRNSPKYQEALVENSEPEDELTIEGLQEEAKFLKKTLSKGEKVLADFMQADLAKQAQDIAEKLSDLEEVYVIQNNGKPVPQEVKDKLSGILEGYGYFEDQTNYIPIIGRKVTHTEDLLTDVAQALQVAPEGVKRTKIEPDLGHRGVDTNLFRVWKRATNDQSHFLAYADVVSDMWTVLRGGRNRLDNLLERKFGRQVAESFDAFVHAQAKPTEHIAQDGVAQMATKVRSMAALSFLGWNLMTIAKQVPSFMYFSAKVPLSYLIRTLHQATTKEGRQAIMEVVQREPQMRDRQMEQVLTELDNMDQAVFEKTFGKVLAAMPGIDRKKAMRWKKKTFKSLMWGIRKVDQMVTFAGYFAVYQHQKAMGVNEKDAMYNALQAVLTTQPAADVKDVPRLWRHGPVTSTLLLFTNQLTKIYNMGMHDILLKSLANKEWTSDQTRAATALAMGAIGIGMISHGFRWEDDDENTGFIEEGGRMLVGGALSTVPLAGSSMAAAWNNWPATTDLIRSLPHSFVMTDKHLSRAEWEKAVKSGMRTLLIPGQSEMIRVYEAATDYNYDWTRVLGRKPVYDKPEKLIPLMQQYKKIMDYNKHHPEEGRRKRRLLREYKREADRAQRKGDVKTANKFKTKARKLRQDMPELKLKRQIFSTYPNKWGYKKSEVYRLYRSL